MVRTDCFAYEKRVTNFGTAVQLCRALNALYCKHEECKFFKTPEQACLECIYTDCKGCANIKSATKCGCDFFG